MKTTAAAWAVDSTKVRRPCAFPVSLFWEGRISAGPRIGGQLHTFRCVSVLHHAVVAWDTVHIWRGVEERRAEGSVLDEATLALTTPVFHKRINPYGRYHFDGDRMRQPLDPMTQGSSCGFSGGCGESAIPSSMFQAL